MEININEKIKKSKTFCILPFVHLYVHPDGNIAPCCIGKPFINGPNMKNTSVENLINSKGLKEVREAMSNEKKHIACTVCYDAEKLTGSSQRHNYNEQAENGLYSLPVVQQDYTVPTDIQHLDIRFSNLCNLKCRMCNPEYSSMWYEDWSKVHGESSRKEFPTKLIKADENPVGKLKPYISKLRSVYFAGGEPLIMKEHMETLTYLHETFPYIELTSDYSAKDLQFHYNTNLHVLKYEGQGFIEKWKDFKKVNLSISCDGIGPVGEFQRTGFKTERFLKNLNTLIKSGFKPLSYRCKDGNINHNLLYNFQYTVTPINVYHIFEFIDFLLENNYINHDYDVDFRYAWGPSSHTIKNMPPEYKAPALKFLEGCRSRKMSYTTSTALEGVISYIQEEPEVTPDEFHRSNKTMDNITSLDSTYSYLDFISNNYIHNIDTYSQYLLSNQQS